MTRTYEEIAHDLIGTATTPEEVDELIATDEEFCAVLDGIAFACVQCGWWCDISEEASEDFGLYDWTCRECCEENI